jgi:hypothetical protein
VPTFEQQQEYTRLSGLLQKIGLKHRRELPQGVASLAVVVNEGEVRMDIYDNLGKVIGIVPNQTTSLGLRDDLQRTFGSVKLPDENVIAPL